VGDIKVKFLDEYRSITIFKGIYLLKKIISTNFYPKIIYPNIVIYILFGY